LTRDTEEGFSDTQGGHALILSIRRYAHFACDGVSSSNKYINGTEHKNVYLIDTVAKSLNRV